MDKYLVCYESTDPINIKFGVQYREMRFASKEEIEGFFSINPDAVCKSVKELSDEELDKQIMKEFEKSAYRAAVILHKIGSYLIIESTNLGSRCYFPLSENGEVRYAGQNKRYTFFDTLDKALLYCIARRGLGNSASEDTLVLATGLAASMFNIK